MKPPYNDFEDIENSGRSQENKLNVKRLIDSQIPNKNKINDESINERVLGI